QIYRVRLRDHATATPGTYVAAKATFALSGTLTAGDVIELSWLDEHYFHTILSGDTADGALLALAATIDALSPSVTASHGPSSNEITLTNRTAGDEGNRLGIVATVGGVQTETWTPAAQTMAGGASPSEWRIDLDLSSLMDAFTDEPIPTTNI